MDASTELCPMCGQQNVDFLWTFLEDIFYAYDHFLFDATKMYCLYRLNQQLL